MGFRFLAGLWMIFIFKIGSRLGYGSSVGIWSWFNLKTLCAKGQRFKSPFRSSYSENIFYEKKKFDDLRAHYHCIALPTIWDTYWARLGKNKIFQRYKNLLHFKISQRFSQFWTWFCERFRKNASRRPTFTGNLPFTLMPVSERI